MKKFVLNLFCSLSLVPVVTVSAQEFYNPPDSSVEASNVALREGNVGAELGMIAGPEPVTAPSQDGDLQPEVATDLSEEVGESGGGNFSPMSLLARRPFRVTVSVREGWDSNVNTTRTNQQQSFYTNFAAGISYNFGGPRLRLSTNLGLGYTFYTGKDVTNPDRLSGLWTLAAVYSVSPRLTISASTSTGYYSQPNIVVQGTNISQQGDYFSSSSTISALYQWRPRFSTTTSYSFSTLVYADQPLNDEQGRITQTLAQSFNFMFWPTTTLVAEYRVSPTTYYSADLDTLNQYGLVGFDHVFSPRSSWNARLGVQFNFLNNPIDGTGTYIGPYGETAFSYQYGQRGSLSFTARYGTEASGLNNVTERQTFRSGFAISQGLTARLSASGGLYYAVNYYNQDNVITPFFENVVEGTLGLNYSFNRFLSASTGYRFTGVLSQEQPEREYNRNVVFIGLNGTF